MLIQMLNSDADAETVTTKSYKRLHVKSNLTLASDEPRDLRSRGCLSFMRESSYLMFGPLGESGVFQITEINVWECGVAEGASMPVGTEGLVVTCVAELSVQPPSESHGRSHLT